MERIAYQHFVNQVLGPVTILRDPFIKIVNRVEAGLIVHDIYLVDTQPVIDGAKYVYLLVRLSPNGEIEEVIPTNEVQL